MPDVAALSRRSFLAGLGGLVLLAACGSGDGDAAGGTDDDGGDGGYQALRVSSDLYATDRPQRFAFALAQGSRYVSGPPARIAFRPPGGTTQPSAPATLHADGLPAGRGVYVVDAVLATAGIWESVVEVGDTATPLPFQVAAAPTAPVVGAAAPRAPSPTLADPLGVDPICTLDGGPCPMHDVSLDAVVATGRPVLVSFSTPARCQTRYCGPTLEQVVAARPAYQADVSFVHVEIYERPTGPQLVSTVRAWGLQTEPWLFGVDGAGTIVGRLDGAFGTGEVEALLDRLAGA